MPNIEELVDQLANLSDDERAERLEALTPEETKELKDYNVSLLGQITARRAEKRRQDERVEPPVAAAPSTEAPATTEAPAVPPQSSSDDFKTQYREEQKGKAKKKVFAELGITESEGSLVADKFAKLDSGALDADLIAEDWRSAVAAAYPAKFIAAQQAINDLERGASDFMANQAGAGINSSGGRDEGPKYSPRAQEMVRQAQAQGTPLTLEDAEAYLNNGDTRVYKA